MPGCLRRGYRVWLLWYAAAILIAVAATLGVRLTAAPELPAAAGPPIQIFADWSQEWAEGNGHVGVFRGHCQVIQGDTLLTAEKLVIWVRRVEVAEQPVDQLTLYFEDEVRGHTSEGDVSSAVLVTELRTGAGMTLSVRGRQTDAPGTDDALYCRALSRREGKKRQDLLPTQLTLDPFDAPYRTVQLDGPAGGIRRVRVFQRGALPFSLRSEPVPNTVPPEQIALITGGVNLLVDVPETIDGIGTIGLVDLSADRAVIWTTATLNGGEFPLEQVQTNDTPYQVYLEGNIIIRQGTNVVRAERAFYDARENQALILNAEFKAFVPEIDGAVRIRADRLRQLSQQQYHAQNAWITTSQFGKPGYRLQASDIFLDQRTESWFGQPRVTTDPQTGQSVIKQTPWVTAHNTTLLIDDFPIFYTPYFSAPGDEPNIPLESVTFRQDRIFGTQIKTRWNVFQLFGLDRPDGARWNLELDYLSERGPFFGTDGRYQGVDPWGRPYFGAGLASYVHDDGEDNLGLGRRDLVPESNDRGRILWRHQHTLSDTLKLKAEVAPVFDRNYLEQYYENEFDRGKDQETLAYLQNIDGNKSWSLLARPQVNWFENNTQWLPRGDLTVLNQSLFDGWLTWSTHTSGAYATLNPARAPTDPNDTFTPIPYYTEADGLVAMTRHELQAPFNLGPVKVAPYVLGEAAFWSDGFTQESVDRLYGRAGVRASLMSWKVYPYARSDIFNINGLAHKMLFDVDAGVAASSRDLSEIPQWNEINDDAQERYQERFLTNTFGGVLPPEFDPRFFAVRSLTGTSVTAPYHELVDDQQAIRLGWRHRLQTKVGPPDRQRIKDWMTLDLGVTIFPDGDRDNFGETLGLLTSRFAWNVGDRTTLLATTMNDFFDEAANLWSVGVLSQRSVRGSLYVGFRNIQGGPLDSRILTASYSYQMSPKWVSTATTAYDVGENENRGQSLTVTRVGEWFLLHTGFNFDASKNNVGVAISVEPRLGNGQISSMLLGPLLNGY